MALFIIFFALFPSVHKKGYYKKGNGDVENQFKRFNRSEAQAQKTQREGYNEDKKKKNVQSISIGIRNDKPVTPSDLKVLKYFTFKCFY